MLKWIWFSGVGGGFELIKLYKFKIRIKRNVLFFKNLNGMLRKFYSFYRIFFSF